MKYKKIASLLLGSIMLASVLSNFSGFAEAASISCPAIPGLEVNEYVTSSRGHGNLECRYTTGPSHLDRSSLTGVWATLDNTDELAMVYACGGFKKDSISSETYEAVVFGIDEYTTLPYAKQLLSQIENSGLARLCPGVSLPSQPEEEFNWSVTVKPTYITITQGETATFQIISETLSGTPRQIGISILPSTEPAHLYDLAAAGKISLTPSLSENNYGFDRNSDSVTLFSITTSTNTPLGAQSFSVLPFNTSGEGPFHPPGDYSADYTIEVKPAPSTPSTPTQDCNFSINIQPSSLTISQGQTATFNVILDTQSSGKLHTVGIGQPEITTILRDAGSEISLTGGTKVGSRTVEVSSDSTLKLTITTTSKLSPKTYTLTAIGICENTIVDKNFSLKVNPTSQVPLLREPESTTDSDGDGIPDNVDQCPNRPEIVNYVDDFDGCPDVGRLVAAQYKAMEKNLAREQLERGSLEWYIAKGSDVKMAIIDEVTPESVELRCYDGCSVKEMNYLNGKLMKTIVGPHEKKLDNLLDETPIKYEKAAYGTLIQMGEGSKFLYKDLPVRTSLIEAETWYFAFTGEFVSVWDGTELVIETKEGQESYIAVFEGSVYVFVRTQEEPIILKANESLHANGNDVTLSTFDVYPSELRWWEDPTQVIENPFVESVEQPTATTISSYETYQDHIATLGSEFSIDHPKGWVVYEEHSVQDYGVDLFSFAPDDYWSTAAAYVTFYEDENFIGLENDEYLDALYQRELVSKCVREDGCLNVELESSSYEIRNGKTTYSLASNELWEIDGEKVNYYSMVKEIQLFDGTSVSLLVFVKEDKKDLYIDDLIHAVESFSFIPESDVKPGSKLYLYHGYYGFSVEYPHDWYIISYNVPFSDGSLGVLDLRPVPEEEDSAVSFNIFFYPEDTKEELKGLSGQEYLDGLIKSIMESCIDTCSDSRIIDSDMIFGNGKYSYFLAWTYTFTENEGDIPIPTLAVSIDMEKNNGDILAIWGEIRDDRKELYTGGLINAFLSFEVPDYLQSDDHTIMAVEHLRNFAGIEQIEISESPCMDSVLQSDRDNYQLDDFVIINLISADSNQDYNKPDVVSAKVINSAGEQKIISLDEAGDSTGVFQYPPFEGGDDLGFISEFTSKSSDTLTVEYIEPCSGKMISYSFTVGEGASQSVTPPTPESNGGGCLIATATYGSELAPQVQFLREIRDNTVMSTVSGASFMTGFNTFYYSFSPYIADLERQNPIFKEVVKVAITPLITSLSLLNYVEIDSETKVLGYGIGIILLNIGMYFVIPAIFIYSIRKKFIKD